METAPNYRCALKEEEKDNFERMTSPEHTQIEFFRRASTSVHLV